MAYPLRRVRGARDVAALWNSSLQPGEAQHPALRPARALRHCQVN